MDNKATDYVRSLITLPFEELAHIERQYSYRNDVQPPAEREIGALLAHFIQIHGTKKILEIGTSNGYTSLWMASVFINEHTSTKNTQPPITTIDYHSRLVAEAKRYFKTAGVESLIKIMNMDVIDALLKLREELTGGMEQFDLIFQDGGKALYRECHEYILELLKIGGLYLLDDTLLRFNPETRPGLGKKIDDFLQDISKDHRLRILTLPLGHGFTIAQKIKD